jgi:Universal stress protein family
VTGVPGRPVVADHAAEVLVHHSAEADLLVLGLRKRNPVAGLLLGSTSEHCAQHAHCPVMVSHDAGERQFGGQAFVHGQISAMNTSGSQRTTAHHGLAHEVALLLEKRNPHRVGFLALLVLRGGPHI